MPLQSLVLALQQQLSTKLPFTTSAASMTVRAGTNNSVAGAGQLGGTRLVELCADTACFVLISSAGTQATTSTGLYLPANVPRTYTCNPGDTVSVIGGGSGNLYVTEGN